MDLVANIFLGKLFRIPIYLHWTWVLFFIYLCCFDSTFVSYFISIFFIVLLHELGHCFACRYYDGEVKDITFYPIGGIARIQMPVRPFEEMIISLAGPFVNVLLIPILAVLNATFTEVFTKLFYINLVILLFNLIPLLPLDGGRVFRALLEMYFKDKYKATKIAVIVTRVICILVLGFIGFSAVTGNTTNYIGLMIIALFAWIIAESELDNSKKIEYIHQYIQPLCQQLTDGRKEWLLNDKLHREDGPAVEWPDGTKYWLLNDKLHREDGPAVEWPDGTKYWFLNDKCHREDGPAVEHADGTVEWWIDGVRKRRV